jgi:hypothetical protein
VLNRLRRKQNLALIMNNKNLIKALGTVNARGRPSGAALEHLHIEVVGGDFWSSSIHHVLIFDTPKLHTLTLIQSTLAASVTTSSVFGSGPRSWRPSSQS